MQRFIYYYIYIANVLFHKITKTLFLSYIAPGCVNNLCQSDTSLCALEEEEGRKKKIILYNIIKENSGKIKLFILVL